MDADVMISIRSGHCEVKSLGDERWRELAFAFTCLIQGLII
jgi:hypothetical protein